MSKILWILIEKGLLSNIKKIKKYTKDKLNTIQSFYDSILNMNKNIWIYYFKMQKNIYPQLPNA